MRKVARVVVALLALWPSPWVFGDTFLIVTEEFRNGEYAVPPTASQEGVMSAMFDLGHITFETGTYRPQMDWDGLSFAEPLRIAREGGARFLGVVRVSAEARPRRDPPGNAAAGSRSSGTEITARAEYLLFDAETSRLLGRGELTASNLSSPRPTGYDELLFETGETVARELLGLRVLHSGTP